MKTAKNIFLSLGILFILFNILGFVGGASPFPKDGTEEAVNKVAYFIGANLFIILGLIFLFIAYRFNKKIQKKREKELLDSLIEDQNKI